MTKRYYFKQIHQLDSLASNRETEIIPLAKLTLCCRLVVRVETAIYFLYFQIKYEDFIIEKKKHERKVSHSATKENNLKIVEKKLLLKKLKYIYSRII